MPKEYVNSRYADSCTAEPVVELTWGREREWVQLATILSPRDYELRVRSILETLTQSGIEIPQERMGELAEYLASVGVHGVFVQLGRGELNDLIRHLRRARDQAYGADA